MWSIDFWFEVLKEYTEDRVQSLISTVLVMVMVVVVVAVIEIVIVVLRARVRSGNPVPCCCYYCSYYLVGEVKARAMA